MVEWSFSVFLGATSCFEELLCVLHNSLKSTTLELPCFQKSLGLHSSLCHSGIVSYLYFLKSEV
jgi:hypothetical protein